MTGMNLAWSQDVNPDKRRRENRMLTQADIAIRTPHYVRTIGGGGTVKELLHRASYRTGLKVRRLKMFLYGEALPKAHEWENLKAFAERVEERMARVSEELHELDREIEELRGRQDRGDMRAAGGVRHKPHQQ